MATEKVFVLPNTPTPNRVLDFDPELCRGCNQCVEVCPTDVLIPNPEKGNPPLVLYPEECWYCGGCVEECPHPGALTLIHPASQRISVNWKRKETGEYFHLGLR
ncbi:MAG: 4Fe-4S dicluster domain-containing protein [Moorellales bacterium]